MKKRRIVDNVLLAVNAIFYTFLLYWYYFLIGFNSFAGEHTTEEKREIHQQFDVCYGIFIALVCILILYLVYRFISNFFLSSKRLEEKKKSWIKKVSFSLSIGNLLVLLVLTFLPQILSMSFPLIHLPRGYFISFILPLFIPIGLDIYYLLTSDFWKIEKKIEEENI